nr:MAG: hypothetical protein [White spot syndrome virus]BDX27101.1 MAG: hypothetical protein [White spot syndrome virus]
MSNFSLMSKVRESFRYCLHPFLDARYNALNTPPEMLCVFAPFLGGPGPTTSNITNYNYPLHIRK